MPESGNAQPALRWWNPLALRGPIFFWSLEMGPHEKEPTQEGSLLGPFNAGVNFTKNSPRDHWTAPHSVWRVLREPGHLIFHLSPTGIYGTHLELDRCDGETVVPGLAFLNRRSLLFVAARGCLKRRSHGEEAIHSVLWVCNCVLAVNSGVCSGSSRSREDAQDGEGRPLGGDCRQEQSRQIHLDSSEGGFHRVSLRIGNRYASISCWWMRPIR